MLSILEITLPVFLIVGAGYLATRIGLFRDTYAEALMYFTQTFAIPCLLFLAIAKLDLAAVFRPEILLTFYTGSALSFLLGLGLARKLFGRSPGEAVAIGFCSFFANSVLLGMPLVERAFGTEALAPVIAIVSIHAPFCYTVGITSMELARADGRSLPETFKVVLRSILTNGLMVGLVLGFLVNLTGLALPAPLEASLRMMSQAALPAALFGLGGFLVRYGIGGQARELAMIGFIRLVVHPSIALVLATQVFGLSPLVTKALVLAAAMPPGVNVYVFANIYDRCKATAAASIITATIGAVFTATLWLSVLAALGL